MKRRHSSSDSGSEDGHEADAPASRVNPPQADALGVSGTARGLAQAVDEAFHVTETERLEFLEMYGFDWAPEDPGAADAMEIETRPPSPNDEEGEQLRGLIERARKMRRTEDKADAPGGGGGGLQFESDDSDDDDDDDDSGSSSSEVDDNDTYRPPKRTRHAPRPETGAEDVNAHLGRAALGPDEEPGMRKAVSYEHYYQRLTERLEKKFEMVMARAADVYDKNDYAAMDDLGALAKTGDEVIDDLEKCFAFMDANGFRRSKQQRAICDIFIRGCLRHIYKEELRTDLIRIFRQFGIRRINNMVMVTMPRRCGKTTITSIFVAAYLLCVPNAKVVVYSISRRTSSMLSAKVLQFLSMMQPEGWHPKIHNQENIAFVNNAGTWASLASYPAAERISITLISKGAGASLFFFSLFEFFTHTHTKVSTR